MNKKGFLLIGILIAALSLFANGGLFGWKGVHGSVGRLVVASQTVDLSSLNDEIGFNFEVTYPETFLKYGAQYHYITNNVVIGAEGYLVENGYHSDDVYKYKVSGNAFFADLGVVLYSNYYTMLVPWAGIGLGSISYSMCSNEQTWIQAVDQGIPYVFSASKQNLAANFGISWDAIYRKFSFGIHASYMFPVSEGDWQVAGEVLEDGPDTALEGLHIGISVGFTDIDMW